MRSGLRMGMVHDQSSSTSSDIAHQRALGVHLSWRKTPVDLVTFLAQRQPDCWCPHAQSLAFALQSCRSSEALVTDLNQAGC